MSDLLTSSEAAKKLFVKSATLIAYAKVGKIGHHLIGRKYLFSENHIAEYIAATEVPARSGPAKQDPLERLFDRSRRPASRAS